MLLAASFCYHHNITTQIYYVQKLKQITKSPWTRENPNVQGNYAIYTNLYTMSWTCVLAAFTNRSTNLLHHKFGVDLIWTLELQDHGSISFGLRVEQARYVGRRHRIRGDSVETLPCKGVVPRSHPAQYIITEQNLPRWHLIIHPRRSFGRMSVTLLNSVSHSGLCPPYRFNSDAGCQKRRNQYK